MTARSDTGPRRAARGLATWLIPPARDWQRKSGGIAHSRLAWPLLGLGAVLLALTGLTAWSASGPSGTLIPALEAGLALLGLTLVVATALLIRHDL
ncbi:MAG: hypothetical protein GWN84_25300, partial [Gammaproteobacteria bacterium]|nr:hypothetical protein [Gammaproteobacteria bacterium]NIR85862.1 hypothetical protein [Gammaproteobacteria bacterium]NIU06997.1 hypothetical protein [Gammaproteobacteria bacterium]NIV53912.1 hypothetical protein [Gammaproteobacteria bacterium]NIX88270.1 hypothetical protein [Gammaproteobacteria bacterium]